MSYILDALKKADAQRERDPARGIHAQPAVLAGAAHAGESYRNWAWGAGAAAVLAIAWAFWATYEDKPPVVPPIQTRSEPAPAPVAAAPVPVIATPAAAAVTAAAVAAVPAADASSQHVATAVQPPPAAARIEPAEPKNTAHPTPRARPQLDAAPRPGATVASRQPGTGSTPAAGPAAAPAEAPPHAAPAVVASPAAAEASVIARGLPPDAPKLAISGGVYSKNPAQRMLIVNGQVFNQGADLGSGVVLEEIRPKAAVLRFNGGRYSVSF